jgi:hypothetical protein
MIDNDDLPMEKSAGHEGDKHRSERSEIRYSDNHLEGDQKNNLPIFQNPPPPPPLKIIIPWRPLVLQEEEVVVEDFEE